MRWPSVSGHRIFFVFSAIIETVWECHLSLLFARKAFMSTSPGRTGQCVFDALITELLNSDPEQSLIDICLSGNQKAVTSVPLRYRLIALGFVQKMSLQEVNDKLRENSCDQLYARSLSEATLIYAFSNGLTYSEWKDVCGEASLLRNKIASDSILSGKTVSLSDIREYVNNNSVYVNELAVTMHRTRILKAGLSDSVSSDVRLKDFLLSNISSFCSCREKSRYYFCKYLMYYLEHQKNRYLRSLESGWSGTAVPDYLSVFKCVTALKRKKHAAEEADALITSSGLSYSAIYQMFQAFYFEYTSQDWMDILMEKYGDLNTLSDKQKKDLASYIRSYNRKKAYLTDQELLEWQMEELEHREKSACEERSYQTNRAGEKFIRKVLRGELDLDRTTLMSFLVFFDSCSDVPEAHRIDLSRLSDILSECGFSALDPDNYIDDFFIEYMRADDPVTFLIEEAEIMAMSEENFYLYKTYLNSRSADSEWAKVFTSIPQSLQ